MNDVIQMFILLFSIIGVESLLLVFVMWKTPALPFISAFLLKKKIMYLIGKDKTGKFVPFSTRYGSAIIKKEGIYNLTENSHTLEDKTKTPIYFAFRDFAATLTPEYPALLQEIKEKGYKINTIEDLYNLIQQLKADTTKNIEVQVKPFKTYKLHDLLNMFPFNLDPTFVDAQVQGELNKFSKLMKAAPQILFGVIILLVVGAVAVFILEKAFKGQIGINECANLCTTTAQGMAQTTKLIVNNTPVLP